MEEQLKQKEIDHLAALQNAIDDETTASSPLIEQIELCDSLKSYCQKQIAKAQGQEESKEETAAPTTSAESEINK